MATMGFYFQVDCRGEDNTVYSSMYLGHISCVGSHGAGNTKTSLIEPLRTQKMSSSELMAA